MTGHLLVSALDPVMAATLSRRVLHDLLRVELGFEGVIVTDGIEMTAVSGPYGIGGASALAVAAGADAICVGGEHAGEETAIAVRDAIADAVIEGRLSEERLADAARRVRELARWTATAHRDTPARAASGGSGDASIGLAAARRALRVTRRSATAAFPLSAPPHVAELAPEMNLAIEKDTPGVSASRSASSSPAPRSPGWTPPPPPGAPSRPYSPPRPGAPWSSSSATRTATPGRPTRSGTCWPPAPTPSWSRWACPAAPTSAPCTSPPTDPPASAARPPPNSSPGTRAPPDRRLVSGVGVRRWHRRMAYGVGARRG